MAVQSRLPSSNATRPVFVLCLCVCACVADPPHEHGTQNQNKHSLSGAHNNSINCTSNGCHRRRRRWIKNIDRMKQCCCLFRVRVCARSHSHEHANAGRFLAQLSTSLLLKGECRTRYSWDRPVLRVIATDIKCIEIKVSFTFDCIIRVIYLKFGCQQSVLIDP